MFSSEIIAVSVGCLILAALGLLIVWLMRWAHHLNSLGGAVASSYAPIDVQLLRQTDLARRLIDVREVVAGAEADSEAADSQTGTLVQSATELKLLRDSAVRKLKIAARKPAESDAIRTATEAVASLRTKIASIIEEHEPEGGVTKQRVTARFHHQFCNDLASCQARLNAAEPTFQRAMNCYQTATTRFPGNVLSQLFRLPRTSSQ